MPKSSRLETLVKPHQRNESVLISNLIQSQLKQKPEKDRAVFISEHKLNLIQSQKRHLLRTYEKKLEQP